MFEAGENVGKYKILREIGRGGMGVVYLAEDGSLRRRVALKALHGALGGDADFVERFRREARAVAGLYHPNILRVHTLEQLQGRWAIETEFVEAGSLADAMAGRGVSAFEAVRLVYETLGALERCHEAGIVHRDVKPSNILIGAEGQALLADFGLAKALAEASEESVAARRSSALFVGTPCYAPLEAWEGGEASQSWDVYAAGMVLYEALTGVMPFDGANVLAVMRQKAHVTPKPVRELAPHVSEGLDALVMRMVSADAPMRPGSAATARAALEEVPELSTPAPANRRTVTVARRPSVRLSASLRKVQRSWIRNAPWVAGASLAALLLAVPLLWWAVSAGLFGAGQAKSVGPPPFAKAEEVLQEPGIGSDGIAMDVVEHDSGTRTESAWWLGPETTNGTRDLIAQGPMTLWDATVSNEAGVATVTGHWAGYADAEGLLFRNGELTGTGSINKGGEQLSLTITFKSDRGPDETLGFTGSRHEDANAARRFVYDAEGQRGLPRMLVNELLPRKLGWAKEFELRMPGLWHERVLAAFEGDLNSAKLDGVLDEVFWGKRYTASGSDIGTLAGRCEQGSADFLLRHDGKQLLFALRTSQSLRGKSRVTLSLLPRFDTPVNKSPVLETVWLAGASVVSPSKGGETDMSSPRFVEKTAKTEGWSAEGMLPFAETTTSATPSEFTRWRVNVRVEELEQDGKERTVAMWGSPEPGDIVHGAVLSFAMPEKNSGSVN